MRVILDTSIIVSGLISPHGTPAKVLTCWEDGEFILLYNPAMLEEVEDVLTRAWIRDRLVTRPNQITEFLGGIMAAGEVVLGYSDVAGLIRDPFDEMFLVCARLGKADYLVSVDKDLLALGEFEGTKIVRPARFLEILETPSS